MGLSIVTKLKSDSYLKKIANEIYMYLRETQTYDPQGETLNPAVDKGKLYEHVAGTDEGLDGQQGPYHFDMPGTRYTCAQCNTRTFCKSQNLVLHLVWHMNPVVEKAPNDPDEINFVATDTWLYRFKEKYLWPEGLYRDPVHDMSASRDIDDLVTEFIEAPTLEMAEAPPLEMAQAATLEMAEAPPLEMAQAPTLDMAQAPVRDMSTSGDPSDFGRELEEAPKSTTTFLAINTFNRINEDAASDTDTKQE